MKKIFSAILIFTLIMSLVACSADGADTDADKEFAGQTLVVCNWGEYISDGEDGYMDVVAEFEKRTGATVEYVTADTNESLYAKLKSGAADYDVIFPSDYLVEKLIKEDILAKIDFDNIPNMKNIMSDFLNPDYDPTGEYSVPYFWGTVGIIYNSDMVDGEITSWDDMWSDNYPNQILMFDNPRDAFAIALNKLGYSMNSTNEDEWRKAAEELKKQKFVYVMDDFFQKMPTGNAAIGVYYAGDYLAVAEENEALEFVRPESGTNIFNDAMCIPKTASNKRLAEAFINFMLEPDVGLANTEYLGYSTPNKAVYDLLDDEIKNDEISYPSEQPENWEHFRLLPDNINELMQQLWTEIKSENK